jgi:hypothetical protein
MGNEQRGPGRPKSSGTLIYLGRIRFDPSQDDPALGEFLESWNAAPAEKRAALLKAALVSGAGAASTKKLSAAQEDAEMAETLDSLLGGLF